ncbi:flagellar hook-length control protein FliK [Mesorhizobium neociceri]|uniref:Flagellar hook-length control protein FliK n=1 Tax=Mesorhizobium neociceri TaxID=1307853 RepID=A0A838B4F0_9HYPH|nr:flagellar hook-length control protein FliK [Mesorhizobium neociceri]MBA1140871.1 flagellar hook-length control protein FliK [Mesorhizobium neociceri]
MTTNVGQALPGFAPVHAGSKQSAPNAKGDDKSFGDMVRADDNAPTQKGQGAIEAAPHEPRWARRSAAAPVKGETAHAETGKTASKPVVGKATKDHTDGDPDKASADAEAAGQGTGTAPLQDHLPLLLALHDISRFSAARTGGNGAVTNEQAEKPVLDGETVSAQTPPVSLKKFRAPSNTDNSLDTKPRPERANSGADVSAQDQGQKLAAIEPQPGKLPNPDGATPTLPTDEPASESSAPAAKRSALSTKGVDGAQSNSTSASGKQAPSAGRVDIVAGQSFPAPAQSPMNQTTSALIDALASDNGLRQAVSTPSTTAQTAGSVAVPTHILKIELHPAELGMVTASLRLAGEQLSIELKPETHEAYRRLATDSDAIVKSLRGLGFDVDKVTILQPSIAANPPVRSDASNSQPMPQGRDQSAFQPGNSSGNNAGSGGQQSGRNRNDDAQDFGRPGVPVREHAGDDMFI